MHHQEQELSRRTPGLVVEEADVDFVDPNSVTIDRPFLSPTGGDSDDDDGDSINREDADLEDDLHRFIQRQEREFERRTSFQPRDAGFGVCFWVSVCLFAVLFVTMALFNATATVLLLMSVVPAILVFASVVIFMKHRASVNLSCQLWWSGMLCTLLIMIVQSLCTIVFFLFLIVTRLVEVPWEKGPDGRDYIDFPALVGNMSLTMRIVVIMFNSFLVAALVEEMAKYFITWRVRDRKEFNNVGAAVVYAVCAALGIATLENVFYVMSAALYSTSTGVDSAPTTTLVLGSGLLVALIRGLMSVPLHITTGALIGLGLADRKFFDNRRMNFARIVLMPFVIHGAYDAAIMFGSVFSVMSIPMLILAATIVVGSVVYTWYKYRKMNRRFDRQFSSTFVREIVLQNEPLVLGEDDIDQDDDDDPISRSLGDDDSRRLRDLESVVMRRMEEGRPSTFEHDSDEDQVTVIRQPL